MSHGGIGWFRYPCFLGSPHHFFGTNPQEGEDEDPWNFIDGAPAIPPPLPLTDTNSEDETRSVQSTPPASTQVVHPKRKLIAPTRLDLLPDLCLPKEAVRVYPQDEDSINEMGSHQSCWLNGNSADQFQGIHVHVCSWKMPIAPFFSQSPAGIYSHVCRKHIGVVLACPYCQSKIVKEMASSKESAPQHEEVEEEATHTEDSSSDSGSSSGSSSHSSDSSKAGQKLVIKQERRQLTEAQAAAIMTGATALWRDPPLESLIKYPFSMFAPKSDVIAIWDHPRQSPADTQAMASTAASFVASDIVTPEEDPIPGLEDMPPLEEVPPPHFPTARLPPKKKAKPEPHFYPGWALFPGPVVATGFFDICNGFSPAPQLCSWLIFNFCGGSRG